MSLDFDISKKENRLNIGKHYEGVLLDILNKYNLNFKNVNDKNPFSFYDYIRCDIKNPVILELKTKIIFNNNYNNENIYLVSIHKIAKFRKMKMKYTTLRFIYIYCTVSSLKDYIYNFYEIDLNIIDDDTFFITTLPDNQKYYEVPLRFFKSLEQNIEMLK